MYSFVKYLTCIIAIAVFLTACAKDEKRQEVSGMVKDYTVLTLSPEPARLEVDFPATLQGQQNVEIRPRVEGYIQEMYVDEGASVKKGQKLFKLEGIKYEESVKSAEADVKAAEAAVKAAKIEVDKARHLVEKDIVSKYQLESAEYTLQSQKAVLAQAKAKLSSARTDLSYTYIVSPSDGVIGTIPYRIGSLVSPSITQPLTVVSNISKVYAYFSLNEKQMLELSRTNEGNTTQDKLKKIDNVTLVLSDGSEYPVQGKIETASGLIDTKTGSASLRATFPNNGLLRSGASGSVRVPTHIDSALVIPQRATYEIQGKRFVYVVDSTEKVTSAEIKVTPDDEGKTFIVTEGLKSGEKVVIEGISGLRDGMQIKSKPVEKPSLS